MKEQTKNKGYGMNIDEFKEKLLKIYHPMIATELFQFREKSFRIKEIDESIIMFAQEQEKELIKILRTWVNYLHKYKMLKWFINEYADEAEEQISIRRITEQRISYAHIEFFGSWSNVEEKSNRKLIPEKTKIQELGEKPFVYALEQVLDELMGYTK